MINGLQSKDYKGFTGGKNTLTTLTETPLEACLVAKDVQLGADGKAKKRPGYSLVQAVPQLAGARVDRIFDFQRQWDGKQQMLVNGGGLLLSMDPVGKAAPLQLSAAARNAVLDFVAGLGVAYMSNGQDALRLINNAGVDTVYRWGIDAPAAAVGLVTGSGALNLQYGRQYVYCYVSIITDSAGTPWLSISNPSPISASTGPLANGSVTLEDMPASADPQITHKWVFATVDSQLNSTSAFYFAAEITNATTSWADTLDDSDLDTTRLAPFFTMYPAPACQRVVEYQSRIAAVGITGKPDLVQLSAYEEVDIGIPQEAFPPDLSFQVPGGSQALTGAENFANSLMLSTSDFWFQVTGYDAQTLNKQDKLAQPGAVGFRATDTTPTHLIWVSKDKKLWAWDAVNTPVEMSLNTRARLAGTLSMADLTDATLATAVLRYFSYAEQHLIVLMANSQGNAGAGFDWIQVWDLDSQGAPEQQSEVQQAGRAAQWDFFPTDLMASMGVVEPAGVRALWLGDTAGNVYSWPSGWTDAGKLYRPVYGPPWHHLGLQSTFFNQGPSAVVKRMYWVDVLTSRSDAATAFQVAAVVSDGCDMQRKPVGLSVGPLASPYGDDGTMLRARHDQAGTAIGRWVRWLYIFPVDDQPAEIMQYSPSFAPAYQAAP